MSRAAAKPKGQGQGSREDGVQDGPADRRSLKEARRFWKDMRQLLDKHGKKVDEKARGRMALALRDLEEAFAAAEPRKLELQEKVEALDATADEVLGFARKSGVREFFDSIVVAVLIAAVLRAFVVEAFKIPSGSMIPTLEVGDHIFVNKFLYGLRIPFTNAWLAQWDTPKRGDVIVFRYPLDQDKDYIKRVVAVAGDRIRVEDRDVYVNDQKLERAPPLEVKVEEDTEPGDERLFNSLMRAHAFSEKSLGEEPRSYTVLYRVDDLDRVPVPNGNAAPDGLECNNEVPGRRNECRLKDDFLFVMGDNRDNSADSRVWGGVHTDLVKGKAMFVWWSRGQRAGIRWGRIGKWVD